MKNFLVTLFSFMICAYSFGQPTISRYGRIDVEFTKEKRPKKIYAKVEIITAFTGGDSAWIQSVENSINRSVKYKNGARPGKYKVSVQFIVAKDSTLSDFSCLNDPGFGICTEVLRALKKGSTKWRPAPPGGIKVREYRN